MLRLAPLFFVSIAASMVSLAPAQAAEFTPSQKAEIESILRAYLLENPEILPEAIEALQTKQKRQAIAAVGPALFSETGGVRVGPQNAKVTIVEFYDYQCGFCRRGLPVLERILRTNKDVNVLFRQLPIRDKEGETYSFDAALAALAAAKQKRNFLKFHKALYDTPSRLTKDRILKIAQDNDLDIRAFKADMADPALADALRQNQSIASMLGLRGTPGYIIGDQIIPGAEGYEALMAAVRSARGDG
jgi:protein-disulfide isomerase